MAPSRKTSESVFREQGASAWIFAFECDRSLHASFRVGTLPCLTMEGKVLLSNAAATPGLGLQTVALTAGPLHAPLSPIDKTRTVFNVLESRKVLYAHAYCVGKCLVRRQFCLCRLPHQQVGRLHRQSGPPEAHTTETIGVVAQRGSKSSVVAYWNTRGYLCAGRCARLGHG